MNNLFGWFITGFAILFVFVLICLPVIWTTAKKTDNPLLTFIVGFILYCILSTFIGYIYYN